MGYLYTYKCKFFYDGLTETCQSTVNNAAGGALKKKNAQESYDIFEMLGSNDQHKDTRGKSAGIYEISPNNELALQVAGLQRKLDSVLNMVPKVPQVEVCGICNVQGHSTHMCPAGNDYPAFIHEQAHMMNSYNQRPRNDPFSNTYNPGWRNHPNFSWSNNQNQNQASSSFQPKSSSLEDTVKLLAQNTLQFQQTTNGALQQHSAALTKMEIQLGQIADSLNQREPGKFPSQTNVNPKHHEQAKAITVLRSGKVFDNKVGNEVTNDDIVNAGDEQNEKTTPKEAIPIGTSTISPQMHKAKNPYLPPIPFPGRLATSKHDKSFAEIYDILSKVNVNLPLLDMIRNMPTYAKFFKELNSHKRRYSPHEKVLVSENVSAVLQRKLPPKLKDPGSFTIGITIGNKQAEKAMLDLGASINLMPYSVYLILPADFVVLDMEDAPIHNRELPILLGRPFMATANTLIDVKNGILKMTVLGRTVEFKVFESLSHPSNSVDCFSIDCLDSLVFSKFVQAQSDDDLEIVLTQPLGDLDDEPEFMEVAAALEVSKPYHSSISPIIEPLEPASIKLVPSIVKPPKLELKPLPQHLKYVYLGEIETLPRHYSFDLSPLEEDKLIKVPRDHKNAIGWTIADIKGISPTMCMHRILMEDAKPTREPQRRLNPPMKDVVRTEILKLLDVGVIYPISDSKWVSPIQVVPKKSRHHSGEE
ncbi:unnamed protein product [Prunus brigantina]